MKLKENSWYMNKLKSKQNSSIYFWNWQSFVLPTTKTIYTKQNTRGKVTHRKSRVCKLAAF